MSAPRSQFVTLAVLFTAVILAYYQRNAGSLSGTTTTSAGLPAEGTTAPIAPNVKPIAPFNRELPTDIFKILSKFPSPMPLLRYIVQHQIQILAFVVRFALKPLQGLLVVLAPLLLLLKTTVLLLVVVPYRMVAAVSSALYPVYVFVVTALLFGAGLGSLGGLLHGTVMKKVKKSLPERPEPLPLDEQRQRELKNWRDDVW